MRRLVAHEVPDPGPGTDRADPADAATPDRAPLPRLHAAWHATGYLLKDADAEDVAAAIRDAQAGEVHLDPAAAKALTAALRAPRSAADALTPREREVLVLIATGGTNREIGRPLGVAERTARTHVSNILGKLGLASRTQAAMWAVKEGLVPAGSHGAS